MADVRFGELNTDFDGETYDRWARLIVYEDDYSDCLLSASPFLFQIYRKDDDNCYIGEKKILVGISECDSADTTRLEYKSNELRLAEYLRNELYNIKVVLYTTHERFKEAFFNDFQRRMKCNTRVTPNKEIIYWSCCGKYDQVLLVAMEDLSNYNECKEYLDENL